MSTVFELSDDFTFPELTRLMLVNLVIVYYND